MTDRINDITVYRLHKNKPIPGWEFDVSPIKRAWMDDFTHIYRCLPMTIANQNGWVIKSPCDIKAVWLGGPELNSVHFWLDKDFNTQHPWVKCHFVGGVITFEFDFLIRTSPGTNLLVRGAPNFYVNNAIPLEGLVETDWLNFTFTMNWKIVEPNKIVHFKRNDPICFLQPVPHNYSESFNFNIDFIANNPDLQNKFIAYAESRREFMKELQSGTSKTAWQRHYFEGIDVKTENKVAKDVHSTKLNLSHPVSQNIMSNEQVQQVSNHNSIISTGSTIIKK